MLDLLLIEWVTKMKLGSTNSVEGHPQLSQNRHQVDGALVGAGSLWPGVECLSSKEHRNSHRQIHLTQGYTPQKTTHSCHSTYQFEKNKVAGKTKERGRYYVDNSVYI